MVAKSVTLWTRLERLVVAKSVTLWTRLERLVVAKSARGGLPSDVQAAGWAAQSLSISAPGTSAGHQIAF